MFWAMLPDIWARQEQQKIGLEGILQIIWKQFLLPELNDMLENKFSTRLLSKINNLSYGTSRI